MINNIAVKTFMDLKDINEVSSKIDSVPGRIASTPIYKSNKGTYDLIVYYNVIDSYTDEEKSYNPPTSKMVYFLRKNSKLSESEIAELSFDEASALISEIKAGRK